MSFTEQWFGRTEQDRLATPARSVESIPGLIVEIGSWEGRSTCVMANAIRPRMVHAVDTWAGSPGEISAELAGERDVYATFAANVATLTGGNVTPHRMGWREYVPTITEPVALCFIDAEHTYTEVVDNITAILPMLAPGGVLCGDDIGYPPVAQAVIDMLPLHEVMLQGNMWSWVKPRFANGGIVHGGLNLVGESGPEMIIPTAGATVHPTRLAAEYQRLCNTPSDIYLHLPRLRALVEVLDAKTVIELGTRSGVSTIAWLYALSQTGGHLWSVDIDEAPRHIHLGWSFIQGDDMDPVVFDRLPAQADIVFIDTSHHYQHTLDELRSYVRKVRPGGVIVCHDTELDHPEGAPATDPPFPVKRAIEQFIAETGHEWRNVTECWGLGIIQVGKKAT